MESFFIKYSMDNYFCSAIKLKFSLVKPEVLIFSVLYQLLYCVRGSHVKNRCQLCTRFFVKDNTTPTALNQ